MRAYRALIAVLLVLCVALLAVIACRLEFARPPCERTVTETVTWIDHFCYSCGSGSGPNAGELAQIVESTVPERVIAIDGRPVSGRLVDAFEEHQAKQLHYHGQIIRLTLAGTAGARAAFLRLR